MTTQQAPCYVTWDVHRLQIDKMNTEKDTEKDTETRLGVRYLGQ